MVKLRDISWPDPKLIWAWVKEWFNHYMGGLYHRTGRDHIFMQASGLTFSLFVCIVPLLLIIFSGLGMILEKPSIVQEIDTFINRAIPYEQYADIVKSIIYTRVDEFIIYKNIAGIIGVVGMLFAASGLFSAMRTVLNSVFVSEYSESVIIGKLRDLALVLIVILYFFAAILLMPFLRILLEYPLQIGNWAGIDPRLLEDWIVRIISTLAVYLIFYIVYFSIPRQRLGTRVISMSALWATLLWLAAETGFSLYVSHAVNLKRIYGAYVFLIVVAIWMYYTALSLILGAEIGQLYRERRRILDKRRATLKE